MQQIRPAARCNCPLPSQSLPTRCSKEILANDGVGVIVRSCRWRPSDPAFRPKQEVRRMEAGAALEGGGLGQGQRWRAAGWGPCLQFERCSTAPAPTTAHCPSRRSRALSPLSCRPSWCGPTPPLCAASPAMPSPASASPARTWVSRRRPALLMPGCRCTCHAALQSWPERVGMGGLPLGGPAPHHALCAPPSPPLIRSSLPRQMASNCAATHRHAF